MIVDNQAELEAYLAKIAQLSHEGNPWSPSEYSLFLRTCRGPLVTQPVLNRAYLLWEGTGSIYNGNNSVGYFQVGAIAVYRTETQIELSGHTFKVTEDGPHPKWVMPTIKAVGEILLERKPCIMELPL